MQFITQSFSTKHYKKLVSIATTCLALFTCLPAYATYYLYFINDTHSPVHYASSLNTTGTDCSSNIAPSDYTAYTGTVKPYARMKLFDINYDEGITHGKTYCFSAHFSSPKSATNTFNIDMKLHGDLIGSSIANILYTPNKGETQAIFPGKPRPNNVEVKRINPRALPWGKSLKLYVAAIHYGGSDQSTNELDYVLSEASTNKRYFRDADAHSLIMATYNVQLWSPYSVLAGMRMNQREERVKLISEQIQGYDVVVVEELMDKDLRNKFIQAMSKDYPYHYGPTENSAPLGGGEMIFSHWPIIRQNSEIFKACSGIDCLSAKGVLFTQIKKGEMLYNIFGSHTQATEGGLTKAADKVARDAQIDQIRDFIARQAIPKNQPVIVAGDLNVDYQTCLMKGDCEEFKNTIEKFTPNYPAWSNISLLPYGGNPTINLMNTDATSEMDDYIIVNSAFSAQDKLQNSRIRIIRVPKDPIMYDGGNLNAPYAELDLSDHFLFEKKMHFH